MNIAIIGAGLTGCSAAACLARQQQTVTLIDGAALPMSAASRWNEGKLHLGYVFAKDKSLETARTVIRGSCEFVPVLKELFGDDIPLSYSQPFVYDVHQQGQLRPAQFTAQYAAIDQLIASLPHELLAKYPVSIEAAHALPQVHHQAGRSIIASFQTSEISVLVAPLARHIRCWLAQQSNIGIHNNARIEKIHRCNNGSYFLRTCEGQSLGPFDAVINSSWESRLALDDTVGHSLPADWLHRYKVALHFHDLPNANRFTPKTAVLGEYGDIVPFSDGSLYLSWYPASRIMYSRAITPPSVSAPRGEAAQEIVEAIIEGAATLWPKAMELKAYTKQAVLRGGYIYTRGATDIDDPYSLLHQRWDIGISGGQGYYSVDTGKYCTAPSLGKEVAGILLDSQHKVQLDTDKGIAKVTAVSAERVRPFN